MVVIESFKLIKHINIIIYASLSFRTSVLLTDIWVPIFASPHAVCSGYVILVELFISAAVSFGVACFEDESVGIAIKTVLVASSTTSGAVTNPPPRLR